MSDSTPPARSAFSNLSPNQQLGYGCLVIVLISTAVLYCAGLFSMYVRPSLSARPATPTLFTPRPPTLVATPTQVVPTFIDLPKGTLLSTPTQAPIPTRETPTITSTVDLTNPAPTVSITTTNGFTRTPTRRVTPTLTVRP